MPTTSHHTTPHPRFAKESTPSSSAEDKNKGKRQKHQSQDKKDAVDIDKKQNISNQKKHIL